MSSEQKMTVRELFELHPSAIKVFIKLKLFCVGCPAQTYHTLEDVARIYNYDVYTLLENIRNTVQIEEKKLEEEVHHVLLSMSGNSKEHRLHRKRRMRQAGGDS